MWRVKCGVFAKRAAKPCTVNCHPGGSTATDRIHSQSLDLRAWLRVKCGVFAKRAAKPCTINGHPGAEQCGAIGSTLTKTLGVDSIRAFGPSRMTVNRILKKKRGPGGGCKEGGPWPSQLGKVPLPCPSPGRPACRQTGAPSAARRKQVASRKKPRRETSKAFRQKVTARSASLSSPN